MPRRRAFVALASSAAVLVTVVGVGTILGAADPRQPDPDPARLTADVSDRSDWLLTPGSMALLAASGFALLKVRRE